LRCAALNTPQSLDSFQRDPVLMAEAH
jgi:hypothetical protein